jgi:hypothetical protein
MALRHETEKLDYIWREAIERNRWILEQGGERVKAFIRKTSGVPCFCFQDAHHKQPISDCLQCYGTGILGGYEGPFDMIISPDDAERRVSQKDIGRTVEHSQEVWTGPSPLLSQRDFLVKLNGDRFSVGPVRTPTNRGMVLQQHFTAGRFDEADIRYRVPIGNPVKYAAIQFVPEGSTLPPQITNNPAIPAEVQLRGQTKAWENITW